VRVAAGRPRRGGAGAAPFALAYLAMSAMTADPATDGLGVPGLLTHPAAHRPAVIAYLVVGGPLLAATVAVADTASGVMAWASWRAARSRGRRRSGAAGLGHRRGRPASRRCRAPGPGRGGRRPAAGARRLARAILGGLFLGYYLVCALITCVWHLRTGHEHVVTDGHVGQIAPELAPA
jgi:hypothetical protein